MKKSIDVLIQTEKPSVVLETIKLQYHEEILTPSQLGAIFLAYVSVIGWEDEANGISPEVTIDDLCKIRFIDVFKIIITTIISLHNKNGTN